MGNMQAADSPARQTSRAAKSLQLVVVGDNDLAGDDFCFQFVGAFADRFGENLFVVLIDGVIDASVRKSKTLEAGGEFAGLCVLNGCEDGEVDTLEHAGQDQPGFGPILI